MDQFFVQQFINEYYSVDQTIGEGFAYVIEAEWYLTFQRLLSDLFADTKDMNKIRNADLIQQSEDMLFSVEDFELPRYITTNLVKIPKLHPHLQYGRDYYLINETLWLLLKKYFEAGNAFIIQDCDVVLFVTKKTFSITTFVQFDLLQPSLIVPLQLTDILIAIMNPLRNDEYLLIQTPIPECISQQKFREYFTNILTAQTTWQFSSNTPLYMYFNHKKILLKNIGTLERFNIKNQQIIISASIILYSDANCIQDNGEEEEEQQNIELMELHAIDLEQLAKFRTMMQEALSQPRRSLQIKSQEQIKQYLEQF